MEDAAQDSSATCLDVYLGEMKHFPRITPARELVLGKRIQVGTRVLIDQVLASKVRLKDMSRLRESIDQWLEKKVRPTPSLGEMLDRIRKTVRKLAEERPKNKALATLNRRVNRIESRVREAVDELVTANLRLVVKVAKGYMNRGLSFEDLIQEGNIGLIKAAGKYNYSTGFRFSTYASWWIRQSITRAIYDKARTIRLPVHLLETRNAYYKAFFRLMRELGREPSNEEVAEVMGVEVLAIEELILLIKDPIWLDAPKEEEEGVLRETLITDDAASPLESVTFMQLNRRVHQVLSSLPWREEKVLRMRFGLSGDERVTLDRLGRELRISRERVRQLEAQALNRLRNMEDSPLSAGVI